MYPLNGRGGIDEREKEFFSFVRVNEIRICFGEGYLFHVFIIQYYPRYVIEYYRIVAQETWYVDVGYRGSLL